MVFNLLPATELDQAESLVSQFQNVSLFLGDWIFEEMEKAKQEQPYHILVAYLASLYGKITAEKIDHIFESLLNLASSECPRLRKKVIETTNQPDFESVLFELEVGYLLLQHGHRIKVEPLYPKKGPDWGTTLHGQDVYIEAKQLQHDAEEELLWNTQDVWTRIVTRSGLDAREWNLYERYLAENQFPDSGLHVLAIDTSKFLHSDEMLPHAWDYYCHSETKVHSQHPIHVLILCRREDQGYTSWLNDLTDGAIVLDDPLMPAPDNMLKAVKGAFQPGRGRA